MNAEPIYLDHNGTTPVAAEVAETMWPYLTDVYGNPSSATPQGARARRAVDTAREQVAELIGAHPDEVVFTSGGTESNNLAIRGAAAEATVRVAVTSEVEHPATNAPLLHLEDDGWQIVRLPVDSLARADLGRMPDGPVGIGTMLLAHNETGTIQPIARFADAVHARDGVVHTDAAQAVGKIPVDVEALGVDLLSIAGHKLYAPKGIGALYIRRGTPITPVLRGAGQERGIRPGTENVPEIVGLGAAAHLAGRVLAREAIREQGLRERLWATLHTRAPRLVRVTPDDGALPNTLMIAVPGRSGVDVLADAPAIAASTGSACHAGTVEPPAVLLAMGLGPQTAQGAIRLTLGRGTTEGDIDLAAAALLGAVG